jgi:propionyl-CoA synthetase
MDSGFRDKDGYISIAGREDDVINVAGHRLSTLAMEEAVFEHPDIDDCAVIGIPDRVKGLVPLALFVQKKGTKCQLLETCQ